MTRNVNKTHKKLESEFFFPEHDFNTFEKLLPLSQNFERSNSNLSHFSDIRYRTVPVINYHAFTITFAVFIHFIKKLYYGRNLMVKYA